MTSELLSDNLAQSIQEYGYAVDSLPSVSSNDFSIIGVDEEEYSILTVDPEETVVYIPYDGEYTYFNDLNDSLSVNTFTMFLAFGIGILSLGIVALFKVTIDLFKKITK